MNEEQFSAQNKIISIAKKLASISFESLLQGLSSSPVKYFYSSTPNLNIKFIGIDTIFDLEESGIDRVKNTSDKIEKLNFLQTTNFSKYHLESVPLFLGGMKFAPDNKDSLWKDYCDSDWFIPKFLVYQSNGEIFLIYNYQNTEVSENDIKTYDQQFDNYVKELNSSDDKEECLILRSNYESNEEKAKWISQVKSALDQIKQNMFHKIVLSRRVDLELSCYPNFSQILKQLEQEFPRCYVFAYKKNDSTFFGASPEKLAKVMDGWVEADALAGSIKRGNTQEEDDSLANELLNSVKNLNEQRAVVEFITNSFKDFADEIHYDEKPVIRKLPNIQHLWTPIKAKLKSNKSILSLLKDIHPTPAICGVPWNNALVSIRKMESHSRGLFAGMVGWFNLNNEGEFAVAIRSALSIEKRIYALAGCGIVEGSDPESEYAETELKLRPILSLFKNEEIYQP